MYVHHSFAQRADAPAKAREVLDAGLAGQLAPASLAEVRLIASELVTNAVRHGPRDRGPVEMTVSVGGDVARVEVADAGQGFQPPTGEPGPGQEGGWGLVVVDRLASRWGIEGGRFTRVWAEVPLEPTGTNGGGPAERLYARNV